MFIQIHTLTDHPCALLNRDETGLAKRISIGGVMRTRISSQCLKRHWRMAKGPDSIRALVDEIDLGDRSKEFFRKCVYDLLVAEGLDADAVLKAALALKAKLFPKKEEAPKKNGKDKSKDKDKADPLDALETGQAIFLGRAEVAYLRELVRRVVAGDAGLIEALDLKKITDISKNLSTLGIEASLPKGLELALFGRMVTSDLLANADAAIHVAHAMTVHKEETELDYVTAVDDLSVGSGAAGLFDVELTSGLYYGHVVVDWNLLVENLGNNVELASNVVKRLIRTIATVTPGDVKQQIVDLTKILRLTRDESPDYLPFLTARASLYDSIGDANSANKDREEARKTEAFFQFLRAKGGLVKSPWHLPARALQPTGNPPS